jgi:putative transposase
MKLGRSEQEPSVPSPLAGKSKTMKASTFSGAQKAFILKQGADGMPVAGICRRTGVKPATYFISKRNCEGLAPLEMQRLAQLEDVNDKLQELAADLSLDREMRQDAILR